MHDQHHHTLTLLSDFCKSEMPQALAGWRQAMDRIPVPTVDVLLPLFGATAPAPLLPQEPVPRQFFEPMAGLAMREMDETGVFPTLFGPNAMPETLTFSRNR
jgi:hypothetical protein